MKEKIIKKIKLDLDKTDYFFESEVEQIILVVRKSLNKHIKEEKEVSNKDKIIKVIKNLIQKIKGVLYEKVIKKFKKKMD